MLVVINIDSLMRGTLCDNDNNNNNNNNNQDNVYGALIMAEPLREFTPFI